jgi:hypothetical protein
VAGDEVDHSPPSSVKVKNEWHFMSAPPYVIAWTGATLPFFTFTTASLINVIDICRFLHMNCKHEMF